MRIELDHQACVGHGRCYALAPQLFEPDDRGHCVVILSGDVPAELEEQARTAAGNCPEDALRVVS